MQKLTLVPEFFEPHVGKRFVCNFLVNRENSLGPMDNVCKVLPLVDMRNRQLGEHQDMNWKRYCDRY